MNVVFVEPFFPSNQRHFARALAEAGAAVMGVGESPAEALDEQLKGWLDNYEQVPVEAGYMANAYVRMRHPDYDALRAMLNAVGQMLHVCAS